MFVVSILPILLLEYRNGYAFPIYTTPSSNGTALLGNNSLLPAINLTNPTRLAPRTIPGIIGSCALTVFLCAWTSVHPNVRNQGQQKGLFMDLVARLKSRFKSAFWAIVASELVLVWAVRQWFAAREIRNKYNNRFQTRRIGRWTTVHGHFVIMGGFKLVQKETERQGYDQDQSQAEFVLLTPKRFEQLLRDPTFEGIPITADEIEEKSKRDGMAKLLVIMQTLGFIIQCIGRRLQRLAVTELELVALAMASLNAITFVFWWNKPLAVREPIEVYFSGRLEEQTASGRAADSGEVEPESQVLNITSRDVFARLWEAVDFIFHPLKHRRVRFRNKRGAALYIVELLYSLFFVATYPLFFLFPQGISLILWVLKTKKVGNTQEDKRAVVMQVVRTLLGLRYKLTQSIRNFLGDGPLKPIAFRYTSSAFVKNWFIVIPASFCLLSFISLLFMLLFAASFISTAVFEILATNFIPNGASDVPDFYSPHIESDRYSRMIVFAIFGGLFGGIHCIGWNFVFPTHLEHALWRYTSLALTVIPCVAASFDYILENHEMNKRIRMVLGIFITVLLFVYVPARLSLVAQAFALLRDQPQSAYATVDWTKYLPRFFN